MKKRFLFAYLLPLLEVSVWAAAVLIPALLFFLRLRQMAHGVGSVSLSAGGFVMKLPSDRFLPFAFERVGWWEERAMTILNAPAKFVEIVVSLLVARKAYWYPSSWLPSAWHTLIYPIYALPAWLYVGVGIDAGMGRCLVRAWNAVLSVFLALTCAALFCGFKFCMPAAEREGQEILNWFIDGFALWAVLFAIPFVAWVLRKRQTRLLKDEALAS